MPVYAIEQYELYVARHHVTAIDAAEAIEKILNGDYDSNDDPTLDYVEVADSYGFSVADCELPEGTIEQLLERGVIRGSEEILPSIRRVEQID